MSGTSIACLSMWPNVATHGHSTRYRDVITSASITRRLASYAKHVSRDREGEFRLSLSTGDTAHTTKRKVKIMRLGKTITITLGELMADTISSHPTIERVYRDLGYSPKRCRWDLLWETRISGWIAENIYSTGCTDDHLDTALRAVMKNHGLNWAATK